MVDNNKSFKMTDEPKKKIISEFKAKKDHVIKQNEVFLRFEKDKTYKEIPIKWEKTLKSEGVI